MVARLRDRLRRGADARLREDRHHCSVSDRRGWAVTGTCASSPSDPDPGPHHSARVWRMLMLWRMPSPIGHADQRRAAVGDERQRDAGDRHDPDDHPDVDEELEQDHRGEAGREHRPERVPRPPAGHQDPPEQRANSTNRTIAADEPELLGEDGEHEVGRLDRQEVAAAPGCRWSGPCPSARRSRRRSATGRAGSRRPGCRASG